MDDNYFVVADEELAIHDISRVVDPDKEQANSRREAVKWFAARICETGNSSWVSGGYETKEEALEANPGSEIVVWTQEEAEEVFASS